MKTGLGAADLAQVRVHAMRFYSDEQQKPQREKFEQVARKYLRVFNKNKTPKSSAVIRRRRRSNGRTNLAQAKWVRSIDLLLTLLFEAREQYNRDVQQLGRDKAQDTYNLTMAATMQALAEMDADKAFDIRLNVLVKVNNALMRKYPIPRPFLNVSYPCVDPFMQRLEHANNFAMASFFGSQIFNVTRRAIDIPDAAGNFTPWHYGLFSAVAGLSLAQWGYSVNAALKSPAINRQAATGLTIQTGVATTLATTVFGGFASSALAAAGPIGFFAINGFLTGKSLFDSARNFYYARQLKKNGHGDSIAYATYIQRGKDHLKAAGWHALGTLAVGVVVTFAASIALPLSIGVAAVMGGVKLWQSGPAMIKAARDGVRWLSNKISRVFGANEPASNKPKVVVEPTYSTHILPVKQKGKPVDADMAKRALTNNKLSAWKRSRHKIMGESGLAEYDQRMHYRNDVLLPVWQQYSSDAGRSMSEMRYAMQSILRQAYVEYERKYHHAGLFTNSGKLERKFGLAAEIYHLLEDVSRPLTVAAVHAVVNRYLGGVFQVGALSSINSRVGHMQEVVEAVEYYAAVVEAGGDPHKVNANALRYQHSTDYMLDHFSRRMPAAA